MSYSSNITPGRPPLLWSDVNEAFNQINENFTILASVITRSVPYEIANIDLSNPVRVVLTETHPFENGDQATILNTGISQLDDNIYYLRVISQDEIELYEDEILSLPIDGAGYDSYSSGGGQIQGLTPLDGLDFSNFRDDLIPNETATYQLGSPSKTWKRLYIQEWSDIPGSELNGLWLGAAQIRGIGLTVDLPANSTVDGDLIIDPDKTFFKSVQVDNGNQVVADSFADTLNLNSGTAMQLVVDSAAESVTINNIGVTALSAGTAISVSSGTGNITVSNTGVTQLSAGAAISGRTAGAGISVSSSTGSISITNTGVLEVQQGFGITVSSDPITGIVTVSNAAPAQVTFRTISVSGSPNLVADSTSDILVVEAGYGMIITTDETTDDKLIIAFNQNTDIKGSVFADDSALLVDAVDGKIVGDVETSRLRTSETKIALGALAGATNQGADTVAVGNLAGETNQGTNGIAVGALCGVTNQGGGAIAIGGAAGNTSQGAGAVAIGYVAGGLTQGQRGIAIGDQAGSNNQGDYAVAIGSLSGGTNQGANSIAIGRNAGATGTNANSIILNATGSALTSAAAGFYVDPIRSTANGTPLMYNTSTKELFSSSVLEFIGSTISTSDSSAVQFDSPVTFQTIVTADQGLQLNGVDAIIRSDTSVRIVPTNSLESIGAELTITGLDVMGEPNIIVDAATAQGTIQIGEAGSTASVTVRKSTGEVYVGGLWRFLADGGLYSGYLSAPPDSPTAGAFYVADGTTWDPASKSGAVPYPVFYDGASYHALY